MNKKIRTHKWDEGNRRDLWDDNGRWLGEYYILPSYEYAVWREMLSLYPLWDQQEEKKCIFGE